MVNQRWKIVAEAEAECKQLRQRYEMLSELAR